MNHCLKPKKYLHQASIRLSQIIPPMLKKWEQKKIECFGNMPLKHQPVFIVGAPRSGSTILYQAITNLFDVLYIDNLICRFHKNLFFGFWLSNLFFKDMPHNNYIADHGNTSKHGLHAPSECGQFWYRWLPTDHHFIDYDEITDDMVEQIRLEISAVINFWDKPIVFKNLNAGQRLRLISKCFPFAKVVYLKREPFFTVQSILLSRKKNKIQHNQLWSIKPFNYLEIEQFDEISMCCAQVYYLEKQIEKDAALLSNFWTIYYEDMVNQPEKQFSIIARTLEIEPKAEKGKAPEIYNNSKITVPDNVSQNIKLGLQNYDW